METCCKLSECSTTEDFSSYTRSGRLPQTFDHANRHLVLCESHNGIIFGINLNFSQPHMGWGGGEGCSQGSAKGQRGRYRVSERKNTGEQREKWKRRLGGK